MIAKPCAIHSLFEGIIVCFTVLLFKFGSQTQYAFYHFIPTEMLLVLRDDFLVFGNCADFCIILL